MDTSEFILHVGATQSQQQHQQAQAAKSRSAASPLSPSRPSAGSGTTQYQHFPGQQAREAPQVRYVPQSYGASVNQFREIPYARIPPVTIIFISIITQFIIINKNLI